MKKFAKIALCCALLLSIFAVKSNQKKVIYDAEPYPYGISVTGKDVTVPREDFNELVKFISPTFQCDRLEMLKSQKTAQITLTPEDLLMLVLESGPSEAREPSIEKWSKAPIEIKYHAGGNFVISTAESVEINL